MFSQSDQHISWITEGTFNRRSLEVLLAQDGIWFPASIPELNLNFLDKKEYLNAFDFILLDEKDVLVVDTNFQCLPLPYNLSNWSFIDG
jgi:hypothetical protein